MIKPVQHISDTQLWLKRSGILRHWMMAPALVFAALGCGGEQPPEQPPGTQVEVPPPPEPRETCEENALLCPEQAPPVQPPPEGNGGSGPGVTPPNDEPEELRLARAAAENILRANCGQCHGSQLPPTGASGGLNFIESIPELVEAELIKPLDSENSVIVTYMRNGTMPPIFSTGPRPSPQDIDQVAEFIDNEVFWPDYVKPTDCDEQFVPMDEIFRDVADDLRGAEAEDRPFFRYVSIANRYNAGVCDLGEDRNAVSQLINMLSTRARIEAPQPIDRNDLVFRIDLRDYGWDREIVVDGQSFPDGWEAVLNFSAYAVPFIGNEADEIREDTGTDVAILPADAMLDVASFGNLYYALVGIDVNQSLQDFIANELLIDVGENVANGDVVRAGTTRTRVSRQDRVLERHEIEDRQGVLWLSFDFDPDSSESIFVDPFGFQPGGTEAIFTLPNNMMGFLIADANGTIVEESNILLDTFADDFTARTAVSCAGCHDKGFNTAIDEVGPFAQNNRINFNAEELEIIREVYLPAQQFADVIESDSEQYLGALARAGVTDILRDPVANVSLRFNRDVTLATAAGDLGVTPDELSRELRLLDPVLGVLDGISIGRNEFTAVYAESLCILQGSSENFPDDLFCDALLEQ